MPASSKKEVEDPYSNRSLFLTICLLAQQKDPSKRTSYGLASEFGLKSAQAFWEQLKTLEAEGIATSKKDGKRQVYSLNYENIVEQFEFRTTANFVIELATNPKKAGALKQIDPIPSLSDDPAVLLFFENLLSEYAQGIFDINKSDASNDMSLNDFFQDIIKILLVMDKKSIKIDSLKALAYVAVENEKKSFFYDLVSKHLI